ncbi:unnamed protein product [Didymodactylos carnosus]|uniref:Uncharacterized protein n=1 Tax=Didymodactylos carnosus TaxID=1234261 RepID=A0A814XQH5_9BILA|nr:unnamed protein product [Didymodactylos carnosus]CAF1219014.1 unnamed protein product [Didymodactylos carnosus]CAF1362957.1 unnamed protein product [Didymodactylos carnosus]CAF3982504.1 unnamed protein product [Didymodactylos carnosus]CAF3982522.1 unnamed protein product [Didymodactylos carnosus]
MCQSHKDEHNRILSEDHHKFIDEINNKKLYLNKLKTSEISKLDNYQLLEEWKQAKLDKLDKIYKKEVNNVELSYNNDEFDKLKMKCMNDIDNTLQRESTMTSKDLQAFIIELNSSIDQLELIMQRNSLNRMEQNNNIKNRLENALNRNNYKEFIFNVNFVKFRQIAASHEHILIDDEQKLLLFDKTGSTTVIPWNKQENGFIRDMVWSSYLNKFIILGVHLLFTFDCSTMIIENIRYFPRLNFMTIHNQDILLNFDNGKYLEYWQLSGRWKFVQSWTKLQLGYKNTDVIYKMSISGVRVAMNSTCNEGRFIIDIFDFSSMNWLYCINDDNYNIRLLTNIHHNKWLCINDKTKRFYCTVKNNLFEIKYNQNVIHSLYQVALFNEKYFIILGYEPENKAKLLLYNIEGN